MQRLAISNRQVSGMRNLDYRCVFMMGVHKKKQTDKQ